MKNKKLLSILSASLIASSFVIPKINQDYKLIAKAEENSLDKSNMSIGKIVNVTGIIASEIGKFGGQGFYLLLENNQGIYVYPGKNKINSDAKKGDKVSFTAKVSEYNENLQLTKLSNFTIINENQNLLENKVTISNINDSLLDKEITIENVKISNIKSQGKYKNTVFNVTDDTGRSIEVFVDNRALGNYDTLSPTLSSLGDKVKITGFVTKFKGKYQLKPTVSSDISAINSNEKPETEVNNETNNNEENINKVNNIGEIQGEAHKSPKENQRVTVENVIVTKKDVNKGFYVQDLKPDNNPNTSDAIYVISKETVKVGDVVSITGTVKENYGPGYNERFKTDLTITQLEAVENGIVKTSTAELPTPLILGNNIPKKNIDNDNLTTYQPNEDAIDFWESIEGMRVVVEKPTILGPQKYGYVYTLPYTYEGLERNNAGGISLQEGFNNTEIIPIIVGNKKYRAKAKDRFDGDVIGNVTYDYSEYKVDATSSKLPKKIDGNLERESSSIIFDENKLTIASYNIENFSANNSTKETPDSKVTKIAESFINQINTPDIISLIEVQDNNGTVNDGTTSGLESGNRLANKIKELGGPTYKYVEIAPNNNEDGGARGGNIRVAYLYNPDRVKLSEKEVGGVLEAATFSNGELLKNPSRINPSSPAFKNTRKSLAAQFEFNGEKVIVINNHLSSKRGDLPLYGATQPATESSQLSRIKQVAEIRNFVNERLKQNPNLKFVLTGDFNDFEFSKTIKELEKDGNITNLMSLHEKSDRYSYFYRGNNQSLDNILVSNNMLKNVKFDAIHVNSSFMEEDGRASDHDPLIVQISFDKKQEENINNPNNNSSTEVNNSNNSSDNNSSTEVNNPNNNSNNNSSTEANNSNNSSDSNSSTEANNSNNSSDNNSSTEVNNSNNSSDNNSSTEANKNDNNLSGKLHKEDIINKLTNYIEETKIEVVFKDLIDNKYEMKVNDVTLENKDKILSKISGKVTFIKIFDIELLDKITGNIVENNKNRTVSISIKEKISDNEVASIYYINEKSGKLELIPSYIENNNIVFNVNHFSKYALVISEKEKTKENKLPLTGENNNNNLLTFGLLTLILASILKYRKSK